MNTAEQLIWLATCVALGMVLYLLVLTGSRGLTGRYWSWRRTLLVAGFSCNGIFAVVALTGISTFSDLRLGVTLFTLWVGLAVAAAVQASDAEERHRRF